MKHYLLLFSLLFFSIQSLAQTPIIGSWEGQLSITPAYRLRLVIHITEEAEKLSATMDSPDQGASGIPIDDITFANKTLTFTSKMLQIKYEGVLEDEKVNGTFTQQGYTFPLVLERVVEKPEEPTNTLSYDSEDISVTNTESGLKIAGTVTKPKQKGLYPAVVLIAGSGPMNRNSQVMHHKPFADIADFLTREGIVVLRFDKRGIGQSEGDFGSATFKEFASDAIAMVEYLKEQDFVDQNQLGIIGHSEGGIISQIIGEERPELIDFIVLLASPGTPTIDILVHQNMTVLKDYIEEEKIDELRSGCHNLFEMVASKNATRESDSLHLVAFNEKVLSLTKPEYKLAVAQTINNPKNIQRNLTAYSTPYFQEFLKFIPSEHLKKVTCPVLAINGQKDTQVLSEDNLRAIEKALGKSVVIKEFPTLNHLFIPSETGDVTEYSTLEGTFSKDVLTFISDWVKERHSL